MTNGSMAGVFTGKDLGYRSSRSVPDHGTACDGKTDRSGITDVRDR